MNETHGRKRHGSKQNCKEYVRKIFIRVTVCGVSAPVSAHTVAVFSSRAHCGGGLLN
jgi:hypothetical protein